MRHGVVNGGAAQVRIAVVGPHPDDQELGMGGTIVRLAAQGHALVLIDLTDGEPTPLGDPVTRRGEAMAACAILREAARGECARWGVRAEDVVIERVCLGLKNREVVPDLASRHLVAGALRAWRADVIFVTSEPDAHPDHVAAWSIARDARFDAKLSKAEFSAPIDAWTGARMTGPGVVDARTGATAPHHARWLFGYFATHLRAVAQPDFLVDVSGLEEVKIRAIEAYRTQFVLPEQNRRVVGWVRSALDYFGSRAGVAAAEGFTAPEPVALTGLAALVR
jgi:LmbE family N-acetylglucosaminyl deacetylase